MIKIYTDGSITKNPGGIGGWAFIVIKEGYQDMVGSGMVPDTTNNRMEIQAVLEGIKYVRYHFGNEEEVLVVSDSQYIVGTINDWLTGWMEKELTTKKNLDLWKLIYTYMQNSTINAEWVRGHIGDVYNEKCDHLAKRACRGTNGVIL